MRIERIIKILGLNVGIATFDTVLFSPGLLGIKLAGASTLEIAFGATGIFMSVVVFILGNYKILRGVDKILQTNEIITPDDFIEALEQKDDKKTFEKDIKKIKKQIDKFNAKKEMVRGILLQKFDSNEISYSKFNGAILDIENIFYINIKSIINKLNAFDEDDYQSILKNDEQNQFSTEYIEKKMNIYKEYISFIKNSVEDNDQILLKLDQLILEISKFNSLEDGEIENMEAIKEIDDLINKTKLYR